MRTTLILSRFQDEQLDALGLGQMEENCLARSDWDSVQGPVLFQPTKVSTRLFTALHQLLQPLLKKIRCDRVVISLGLPYRHYLFGKTFPYFAFKSPLRVLWTYDVWEPRFAQIAALVREARIGLLLISSRQAAEYFRQLQLPRCEVHWVPEVIEVSRYLSSPWPERTIDVIAFGRSHSRYHEAIVTGCAERGIKYVFQRFDTVERLIDALGNAKISICFPQSVTHPESVGCISTVTFRYLQSMAAKCVVLGAAPIETEALFGYNPVIEVDWNDPLGQLEDVLRSPKDYIDLVNKNFVTIESNHQTRNFVARVDVLIEQRLAS